MISYTYDAWGNFTTTVHTTDAEKVKHEWGHFGQLSLHGPAALTLFIEVPSISYNIYCQKTGDWTNYYNMPWEWYADYLGDARH